MKRAACVVGILALVVSCGEKKSRSEQRDEEEAAEGGCKLAKDAKPADMVAGKTPQLVPPLAGIKLGMSPKEAAAVCPNLFKGETATKTGTFSASEIIGKLGDGYLHGRLRFTADKLTSVEMQAPAAIADELAKAWGAPQRSAGEKGQALAWFDEATRTRAILGVEERGSRELVISSYVPIKDFVELDTKSIAFKPGDVLGKTSEELMTKFPQYAGKDTTSASTKAATDKMMEGMKKDLEAKGVKIKERSDDIEVRLPATPYADDSTTQVILHQNDDNTIRSYGVWFRTSDLMSGITWPQQREEVIKQFDTLWGPHKKLKETLGEEYVWYDAKSGIRASARGEADNLGELDVSYVRYLPLASFWGAPGPLWGFEKEKRLIGQTPDEVAAAYGAAYKSNGDSATIKLPPTDYESDSGVTTILMFFEGGKVREWRFNIPFESYGPARAEYEAALDAKFGKGKPGKRESVSYGKGVEVRYSDITNNLDVEVSK
ncbi:MAG: hypothetical protein H0T46_26415 [Deltaproteobacteria bacterium]|nr:hypothetical protein [Deltaproteobacteria bacterium]